MYRLFLADFFQLTFLYWLGVAWVSVLSDRDSGSLLGSPCPAPFILRALSLVPAEILAPRKYSTPSTAAPFRCGNSEKSRSWMGPKLSLWPGAFLPSTSAFAGRIPTH